jgi:hypothetical protein
MSSLSLDNCHELIVRRGCSAPCPPSAGVSQGQEPPFR